jgi:hypothetical protein
MGESINTKNLEPYGCLRIKHDFIGARRFVEGLQVPCSTLEHVDSEHEHLESLKAYRELSEEYFGGLPVKMGYFIGHNSNAGPYRYHKSSSILIAVSDCVLELSRMCKSPQLAKNLVRLTLPAGTIVELYGSVIISLPMGLDNADIRMIEVYAGSHGGKSNREFEWECDEEASHLVSQNTWEIES